MSLLMDALRKAEESRAGEHQAPAPAPADPLAAAAAPASPLRSRLPDLSLHADAVNADLAAVSSETPARRHAPAAAVPAAAAAHAAAGERAGEAEERRAVRNVFAAKEPPQSRAVLRLIIGLGVLAGLGLGGYFWWQLQSVSSGLAMRALPPAPTAQSGSAPLAAPITAAAPAAGNARPQPAVEPVIAAEAAAPVARIAAPAARPARARQVSASAPADAPENPLRLARNPPSANPTLARAYDSLQAGRLDEAQRDYELVLRSDAKNTDALLGLATIAARSGQADAAQAFYLRALESDPNDATAQAGLISARGQTDPAAAESRLKTAIAGQPDAAVLHFALGNLYAREQRWSEAQQAYFRAYASAPDNADIIFNLAVSLDHLHQNKLAAQFYERALNAAGAGRASFDANQVKARLLDLAP